MKKLISLMILVVPSILWAQDATFQSDLKGVILYTADQVTSLAEAIPEDKYDYSPSEGIRTVSTSLLHTASANYFFGMTLGGAPPEGVDPMTLETSIKEKAKIIQTLKNSYIYLADVAAGFSDEELSETITFPNGQSATKRMALMIALGHLSEHKGQLIAYGRANNIAPPWSAPQKDDGN
ncbi:MAG: DinB family protein [bacterium]|nr:DinB family protein [bacterium]